MNSVQKIMTELPPEVTLVAAAKTRTLEEVETIIEAGVTHIGYNYIQEALPIIDAIGDRVRWHMIGHLQRNKAKFVAELFDMCQTVDSLRLARYLDQRCELAKRVLPLLSEINSGEESNKTGVMPEKLIDMVVGISKFKNLHLEGLMTMGPRFGDPENGRPYFRLTHRLFKEVRAMNLPGVEMRYLSMGMSNSYRIAIEEGSNIVRIGTMLFGERQ